MITVEDDVHDYFAVQDAVQENIISFNNQSSHHIPFQCKVFHEQNITISNSGNASDINILGFKRFRMYNMV